MSAILMNPNSETLNLYKLLIAIEKTEKPGSDDLARVTGLLRNTLKKIIQRLRKDYGVAIIYHRNSSERKVRGAVGYYVIEDWGVFNKDAVLNLKLSLNN